MSRMPALAAVVARIAGARPSRIGLRLLAFNLLVVFLPVAGILYLDVYESRLLDAQERTMVQQARILAAAVADRDAIDPEAAQALLGRLERRGDARLRVFDAQGTLVADSARVRSPGENAVAALPDPYSPSSSDQRERLLYRVGASLVAARRVIGAWIRPLIVQPSRQRPTSMDPDPRSMAPEIHAALLGRYGKAIRATPNQRSLTMSSAVPVKHGDRVIGAVLVSQSTFRILQAIYAVRLRIFEIVIASVVAAALLSLLMSATIVRPVVRLRREAAALASRATRLPGRFEGAARRDEIGDLSRALAELTRRLDAHIQLLESFAADVSHEFRNPLASIRSAAETIAQSDDEADRRRFVDLLTRDVDRLERLVAGVRELASIDAQLAHEPLDTVDLHAMLSDIAERLRLTGSATIALAANGGPPRHAVRASADRLGQVFDNLLQNARSFTPAGGTIEIAVRTRGGMCSVAVADRGPGIPEAHLTRVFDRFFTSRPADAAARREHAGLGLAIARTIVEGYGGTITASNRPGGGACFEVRLPAVLW